MLSIAMVGCGAIGSSVLQMLHGNAAIRIEAVVVPAGGHGGVRQMLDRWAPSARLVEELALTQVIPHVLVECAGHIAVAQHVLPALKRGIPCIVASIGALGDEDLAARIEAAAIEGDTRVQLVSGAIGGIDALSAARLGGLESVTYTGRKPPNAWSDTPAETVCDLKTLITAQEIFAGSAQEAARLYPKNANVAATVSLAGIGLARTQVRLFADPAVSENVHHIDARGAFGAFELTMRGKPLAANPKTSALTVYSVVRALQNRVQRVVM